MRAEPQPNLADSDCLRVGFVLRAEPQPNLAELWLLELLPPELAEQLLFLELLLLVEMLWLEV